MTQILEDLCHNCMVDCGYAPRDDGVHTARLMTCPRCKKEEIILPKRHWVRNPYVNLPRKP